MLKSYLNVRKLKQLDNYSFQIEWSDGIFDSWRLSELQKCCPCARCVDEATNERRASAPTVNEDVKAKMIQSVGRYALRIQFTEGCSSGIYHFDYLRSLGTKDQKEMT
jgi:ATP-binding protein involved in chromosome partitioning